MLQSLLESPMEYLTQLMLRLPAVLIAICMHESAHGWVANRCGDPTARLMGRITLNPVKHFDPVGMLCLVFFGVGWAKPVPINPLHFRNYRKDDLKVSLAGVTMNLILGFLIMLAIVCSRPVVSSTQISYFDPSALSSEKLQLGDEILEINGYRTNTANDLVYAFVDVGTDPVQMKVRRDGEVIELTDVPFAYEEIEGQTIVKLDFKVQGLEKTPLRVLEESWHMTTGVVKQVWVSFGKLITGQFEMNQLSGPVGVTQMIGEVASTRDYSSIFLMTAFITISIGVFNLLPLPALDGGRLLFLVLELIRGKPVAPKYEGYVHAAGLFLLMGLMLVVTFNDIVRLISG